MSTEAAAVNTYVRRTLLATGAAALAVAVPLAVGLAGMRARAAEAYAPATGSTPVAATSPVLPAHDPDRPTAVVVIGDAGAEVGDVLGPYQVLAATGRFNVYTVAPERRPLPLTGGLDLVPQLSFGQLGQRLGGAAPDVVVAPMMPDAGTPSNEPVTTWLTAQHARGSLVLGVCAGAKILASAGLLDGLRATSHWYRIGELESEHPEVTWVRGVRYVDQGDVVTTAGVLSGIDGTLHVVARLVGADVARDAAAAIGWRHWSPGGPASIPEWRLEPGDAAVAVLNAGYRWERPTIGVRLTDGVGELELASEFDPYGGSSWAARTLAVGAAPIVSAHGLEFVPRSTPDDARVDRLVTPGDGSDDGSDDGSAGFPFDATLADLARSVDAPTARFTAKILEYPASDAEALVGPGISPGLAVRPLLLGLATAGSVVGAAAAVGRLRR
jgi:putative intracellular protease/amidase